MADLFIHRVSVYFSNAENTEAFAVLCQPKNGNPPSLHDLYLQTMSADWSPNHRRGTLHIAQRIAENGLSLHYTTTDCDNTDFLQALDLEKFGITHLKGDYYHEYGAFEVGEFTRTLKEWKHNPIHLRGEEKLFTLRHNQAKEALASLDENAQFKISFDTDTLEREMVQPIYTRKESQKNS